MEERRLGERERERQGEEDEDEEVVEEEMMQGRSSILYLNSFISLILWGIQLIYYSSLPTSRSERSHFPSLNLPSGSPSL